MVKVEYINPFIDAVGDVFRTMLNAQVRRLSARLGDDVFAGGEDMVTSIIAINGVASGVVGLCLPRTTALAVAGRMLSTTFSDVTDDATDALAEVVNMVGGAAKGQMELDPVPELGLPSVIAGGHYKIRFPTKTVWVELPFTSPLGDFVMKVSFCRD